MGIVTKRMLVSIGLAITYSSAARAQAAVAADAHRLLSTLYTAISRGDSTTARSLLADDLVWIVSSSGAIVTKSQLLAAASVPSPVRFEIDSLRTRQYGATIVADYIRRDHRPLGTTEFTTSWRALAVVVRSGGALHLVRHTVTWLAQPVKPVVTDSSELQPFLGRYQIAPGYIDNVHWEGGQLVATASGQTAGARLVPVSVNAFSPDGMGAVIMFERDATGRVVGYVQAYPDGRIIRARRLR